MFGFDEPGARLRVHFIGIGGISMSGLARILATRGHQVTGCDRKPSHITEMLEASGIKVRTGHDPSHLAEVDAVIHTAAIRKDEPELAAAREMGLIVIERAALLGQIARAHPTRIAVAGTHGKTTTTGMTGLILDLAGLDPTISLGGELEAIGGNVRLGGSEIFLTEACEYVESFLHLAPTIAVVLNVEPDHPDFFRDLNHLKSAFSRFVNLVPASGRVVTRLELPIVAEIAAGAKAEVVDFGLDPAADFHPEQVQFDSHGLPSFIPVAYGRALPRVSLEVPGIHNVLNALAALAVADILHVPPEVSLAALHRFSGTKRRFERKGFVSGAEVIDDYAHHPTEVKATLLAARNCPHNRIWCVFQPHTYSRTKSLLSEFADALSLADRILLTDIYAAREIDQGEIHARDLAKQISSLGHEAFYMSSFNEAVEHLRSNLQSGDLVLTMGAGDISRIGDMLLQGD